MKFPEDKVQFVDRPELPETFVDSVNPFTLEGQITRMEFCVTRIGKVELAKQPHPKRYPICRIVMTPEAVIDTFNQLQNLINVMENTGLAKRHPPLAINTPPVTMQ